MLIALFSCNSTNSSQTGENDSTAVSVNDEQPINQRYGIKSGIVYYNPIDIMGMKTTQILYFDDYGKKEVMESIVEGDMMGFKTKKRSIKINDGEYIVEYDLENIVNNENKLEKVARKTKIQPNAFNPNDLSALTEEVKKQFDYKEEGTEEVAGVVGTKISMKFGENNRAYAVIYKNIPLKSEFGGIQLVANKFDQNVSIPVEKFSIPQDYKVEELQAQQFE